MGRQEVVRLVRNGCFITDGVIDLHIHPYPCLFPRPYDDIEIAARCAAAGMRAILFKSHFESTVSRAYLAGKQVPGIKVFGSIVLNRYVGGFNPAAVESALRQGARTVWMPTIDAAGHASVFGGTGVYGKSSPLRVPAGAGSLAGGQGLSVLKDGELIEEVKQIIGLIAEYDAILETSHLSKPEIWALVRYARSAGVKKIVITHPYFPVPGLTLEELRELVSMGAYAEFTASSVLPPECHSTVDQVAASIKAVGAEHCVIVSDTGAATYPVSPEMLRTYAQWLLSKGVSPQELDVMMVENPGQLLGI